MLKSLKWRFHRSMFKVVRIENHGAENNTARLTMHLRVRKWHPLYVTARVIDWIRKAYDASCRLP